jgi:hypothetical protein
MMLTAEEFLAVLATHYRTHRALAPQDIYKLIYQRVFGPEHSVEHMAMAQERLYLEILQLPDGPSSLPLLEPLSPVLCRINLQPFRQRGGSVDVLWKCFRRTVREFRPGALEGLQRVWRLFLATPWARRYAPEFLEQFWQGMATRNFPPVHHSRAYAKANNPHYRVVLRSLVAGCRGLGL